MGGGEGINHSMVMVPVDIFIFDYLSRAGVPVVKCKLKRDVYGESQLYFFVGDTWF